MSVRDFVEDDIKFMYVAYKKGTLAAQAGLSPAEFHNSMIDWMLKHYDYAWTIAKDGKPIGVVSAINCGTFAMLGDVTWMPWASARNKIEGCARIFVELRKRLFFMFHADRKNRDFYVHMAKMGLVRRVGTIHEMADEPLALFQSRGHG